jgi:hypothetical protein
MRMVGHVAGMAEVRNAYKILNWKPEGKRSFRTRTGRSDDDIKSDIAEISLEGVDWIHLALYRCSWRHLVNMAMELLVPYKTRNFLTS